MRALMRLLVLSAASGFRSSYTIRVSALSAPVARRHVRLRLFASGGGSGGLADTHAGAGTTRDLNGRDAEERQASSHVFGVPRPIVDAELSGRRKAALDAELSLVGIDPTELLADPALASSSGVMSRDGPSAWIATAQTVHVNVLHHLNLLA